MQEQTSIREQLGKWAGYPFIAANATMTFRGVVESYVNDQPVQWESLYANPVSTLIGAAFMTSSIILARKGDHNKWVAAAMAAGTIGEGTLAYELVSKIPSFDSVDSVLSVGGTLLSAGLTAHSCYYAIQRELEAQKEETKPVENDISVTKPEKSWWSAFKENTSSFMQEYPMAPVSTCNFLTNLSIIATAIKAEDPILAGVAVAWATGSVLLGLSKAKVAPPIDQDTLKPA